MPLPATRVIPTDWSRHHAPVAAGGMNGKCRIYDPALATTGWDATEQAATLVQGDPVYDGTCRIEARYGVGVVIQADDQENPREYLIQLEFEAGPVAPGFQLVPYECINDDRLNDQTLVVKDEELGTERFTRDLVAEWVQH